MAPLTGVVTFKLPAPLGGAAALFVEPEATAGTVELFVEAMLDDSDLYRRVFETTRRLFVGQSRIHGTRYGCHVKSNGADCDAFDAFDARLGKLLEK